MKMSHESIAAFEKRALELMKTGQYVDAIPQWESVLCSDPNWEHGLAWNELAFCFEETGDLCNAEKCHKHALSIEPWSRHWNAAYCSFAYLHGKPSAAYSLYLRYYQIEAFYRDLSADDTAPLLALGAKLGIADSTILSDYADAIRQGKNEVFPPREVPDVL